MHIWGGAQGKRWHAVAPSISAVVRPSVRGKFVFLGDEKLYVRGVTYGAFRPDEHGNEYHDLEVVERDFAQMAAGGVNAVRIPHTTPPRALLDAALRHGLRVMVGLSAEQYVGFLIDTKSSRDIEELVRARVRACAGHPALLCYALGNEIPASIVRWLGPRRVELYLASLYWVSKSEDPDGLVTYVNYPTSEYLHLPFLDLVCFNVYLEAQERLEAYLARLQNIAGDRPLIMSEIGLDSLRHGEDVQSYVLDWQIRTAFAAGCAGAFVYGWTDEWYRAGADVEDWDFGLTRRDRSPKPALAAVRKAFADVPFPPGLPWPCFSVVVCSLNGATTIRGCFEGLRRLEYPNFEVIVVDDGSTDATAAIARQYGFQVISTSNRGLSSARNTGMEAATGEIVAYIDDDAYPDPHWLSYLAATFLSTIHAAVGGPNIAPPGDGQIAESVANGPGAPVHVLLSDREAEHIPGCNMAVRKECLQAIGGFDPQFRVAGDDVDLCWRLRRQGWTVGFSPAAMVWHHRRGTIRAYWKQQVGYGKAEALLERKWPEKYNATGQLTWTGRIYGTGLSETLDWPRGRIYHGIWGSAPFQSLYGPVPGVLSSLTLTPEWYLVVAALAALCALGMLWRPLFLTGPLLVIAIITSLLQAGLAATRASLASTSRRRLARLKLGGLTALLCLLQPLARLWGHLCGGLTPWRGGGTSQLSPPWPRRYAIWSEQWQGPYERLHSLEANLRAHGAVVLRGGDADRWDLETRGGILGTARMVAAVEEHGAGRQLFRVRTWPHCSPNGLALILLLAVLLAGAAHDQAWAACAVLGGTASLLAVRMLRECAAATSAIVHVLEQSTNDAGQPIRQVATTALNILEQPPAGGG